MKVVFALEVLGEISSGRPAAFYSQGCPLSSLSCLGLG